MGKRENHNIPVETKHNNASVVCIGRMPFPLARHWLLIFLLFCLPACLLAQSESRLHYEIRRIAMREGMEFQYVTSLCRDESGLLWIGTKRGLYFYDGIRLVRFDLKKVSGREIFDPYISNLELAHINRPYLLVSTPRGVLVLDPVARQVVSDTCIGMPEGYLKKYSFLKEISPAHYWVHNHGIVSRLKILGNQKYEETHVITLQSQPNSYDIIPVSGHPEQAWITIKDSVMLYLNGNNVETLLFPDAPNEKVSVNSGLIYWSQFAGNWYGWDENNRVFTWNKERNVIERSSVVNDPGMLVPQFNHIKEFLGSDCELKCSITLPAGQIAIGTNLGLFIIRKRPAGFIVPPELKGKEIRGITADSFGNYFVGAYEGLFVGNKDRSKPVLKYNHKGVWDFFSVRPDYWLLAFENKEVISAWNPITRETASPSPFFPLYLGRNGLSICRDKRGCYWVGSYYGLIWTPDPEILRFIPWEIPQNGPAPILSFVRTIEPDPWGNGILFGCSTGLYRIFFDPNQGKYLFDYSFPNLQEVPVSDIFQDRFQRLWIATKGKGLACMDLTQPHLPIRWVGREMGLCNDNVCMIESSNHDSVLWLSTHNGLARFNTFTESFNNFYEDNGIPNNEFNSAASAKGPDGTLYFGGLTGVVYFNPEQIAIVDSEHESFVSVIKFYNPKTKSINTLDIKYGEGIYLPPYPEYLELQLASTEFINPSKIRYRYRMRGLSDLWSITSGENELKFIRLAPGSYVFELQVVSYDGQLGRLMQLPIHIAEPFYETSCFWIGICFILIGLILWIYRIRMNRLEYKQLIGQQIADDLHDDIGNKLNIIYLEAQKLAKSRENDPVLSKDLDKMMEISRKALRTLQNMIWSVDAKREGINTLFARIQDFADAFLRPMGIKLVFEIPDDVPNRNMNLIARHHVMLIYQEILTNMVKYTQPKLIEVRIRLDSKSLFLNIVNHYNGSYRFERV